MTRQALLVLYLSVVGMLVFGVVKWQQTVTMPNLEPVRELLTQYRSSYRIRMMYSGGLAQELKERINGSVV